MAQIIKHRRGSIGALKDVTANVGELVMATGSIGDLNAPVLFIGESAIAGGYKPVSKIYQGASAPVLGASYGSTMDGTPFYSNNNKTLYILDRTGNIDMDLTGNIEGNTISAVTINNITGTTAYIANMSGSFTGSGEGLYNIPATGITGLNLSKIYSGSVQVTTDAVSGQIHLDATDGIYASGSAIYLSSSSNSFININNNGNTWLYSANNAMDIAADGGGDLWLWAEGGGNVNIGSYDAATLEINRDSNTGNVNMLNGVGNTLTVYGDILQTGSLYTSKIIGTGSLFLQPNDEDSRLFEIYNTTGVTGSDIHIHGINGISYFGNDTNYLKLDDGTGNVTIIGDNSVNISSNVGSVAISSYDGSTLYLNNDGGEGDINVGNNNNNLYGYTTITNLQASNYSQLESNNSYVWVESIGSHVHNDNNGVAGFTARPNSIIEATGSFNIYGDTQISGNTSVTGALVVSNGSATFDQGLVAQNSNMLLTSGSSLIVQNYGNVQTDYLRGTTQEYNYLSLNGNGVNGQPGIELSSTQNISLWAEGGYVNVTGSLNVSGDIIFSGSINIGDNIGVDTINFQGEVSSSILPKVDNAFDLGASGQTWHDIWVGGTAHIGTLDAGNISLSGITVFQDLKVSGSIYDYTLTPTDVVFVDGDQRLTGSANFQFAYNGDYGDSVLSAPIIHASNDGNGTNFLIGNDMWLGDVNEGNATRFMGNEDNSIAKIYLGSSSVSNYLQANYGNVSLSANDTLYLKSQNNQVNIDAYDGNLNLNTDSNNNVSIGGNTYINNNKSLYASRIWDNNDNVNYLQLFGYGTDDGFWWESGNGADTTLYNDAAGNNINVIKYNGGNINIDARNGAVNLHTTDGFNVTGSLVVSDASGVFNSSLLVNNSSLTLDGGSHIHMNDGAHLYFDTCGDIYYDNGTQNIVFYNDCNSFEFRNNVSITGSINVSGGINTDNINGVYNSFNALHLHNGTYGAPDVELTSYGDISLFSEGNNGRPSTINMTGSVHITNDLDITGSVDVLTNLNVSGSASVTGAFTVGSGSITSLGGNLYVSGNLEVLGSSTNVNLESHTVNIGDNIILVNAYSPFQRYAGLAAYDSGSSGVSGSLLWDSESDYWLFVSSSGQSSKLIGTTAGTYGSETNLTSGTFPIANSSNTIGDSLLTYSGTTLAYNVNKFTIDSVSGNTYISGNVTIDTGGDDNGLGTSWVTFRNSDNILGFVDSTDTQDVTTQLLGYDEVDGTLKFSSLIDGGLY